jgi:IclR family transcriptional regulator, pca regulon regulatory protein
LNKSAVQRLAHTLLKLGYLERRQGGIAPGRRVLDRTFDYLRSSPLIRRAVPILASLRMNFNERVDLSLFDDLTIIYVSRMHGRPEMSHAHLIGRRLPTYCTAGGRAALSHLPKDQALDILDRSERRKLTPRTVTDIDEIMALVEQARANGFAISMEELLIGDITAAAAVLDARGNPIGAVHLGGTTADWTLEGFSRRAGPLAVTAARELSGD